MPEWEKWYLDGNFSSISLHPRWMLVLRDGLKHEPFCIEATADGKCLGLLPLAHMRSALFGRYLVSLPYLNTGGVIGADNEVAHEMISQAAYLADSLGVKHLQLRHEIRHEHNSLGRTLENKVHMRLALPENLSDLWDGFNPKVCNQVRKATKQNVEIFWGREELLDEFYDIFSRNMRDLGTPVYPRKLFTRLLAEFPSQSDVCVARLEGKAIAAAILMHGPSMTEVPSASSLRSYNKTNANMLMYWHLLQRAVERHQATFDFGRSSPDSPTYRFKKQWGATPEPAFWQYYVRTGDVEDLRLESGKYDRAVELWKRLPLPVTRWLGPVVVRGIP